MCPRPITAERSETLKQTIAKAVPRLRRRTLRIAAIASVATVTMALLFPVTAYAAPPDFSILDIGTSLKNFICYLLLEGSAFLLNGYSFIISSIGVESLLTQPFDSLFGAGMYTLTTTVYDAAVVPIAESILALFMLVQLVKISQRIDATATLPAVKDIVFLVVVYVLIHWFILNALDVVQAVYQIVADDIIPAISGASSGTALFQELSTDSIAKDAWDAVPLGGALMLLIVSFFAFIIGAITYIIAIVIALARSWQLYIYAAFSAIPVSLLGFDETRQMGIGFLKNFAAACLAGAVMMFLFVAYPYVIAGLLPTDPSGGLMALDLLALAGSGGTAAATGGVSGVLVLLEFLATSLIFALALIKSGSWAREILGG